MSSSFLTVKEYNSLSIGFSEQTMIRVVIVMQSIFRVITIVVFATLASLLYAAVLAEVLPVPETYRLSDQIEGEYCQEIVSDLS